MGDELNLYADAVANFEDAQVVILGVPFDKTTSHRSGSALAPKSIRDQSYNYETYLFRYDFNLESVNIHDAGDTKEFSSVSELIKNLPEYLTEILSTNKFLISIGGEHSITIPIVKSHFDQNKKNDFGIIYLDAHMDFRNSYLDEPFSHACVARRISDQVGVKNIVEIGIRSFSAEEGLDAKEVDLRFFSAEDVLKFGMKKIVESALDYLNLKKIYLSIDMDVLDPSFAPGVGNPEFFGLTPEQLRECIELTAPYLMGVDIVEVSPPYDNGNTSALAAQLIQIIISNVFKNNR